MQAALLPEEEQCDAQGQRAQLSWAVPAGWQWTQGDLGKVLEVLRHWESRVQVWEASKYLPSTATRAETEL